MSAEPASSVTTRAALFGLMRRLRRWPEALAAEQAAGIYVGRSTIHKGLFHFQLFLLVLQALASPSLDTGSLWLSLLQSLTQAPRAGESGLLRVSADSSAKANPHLPARKCRTRVKSPTL